MGIENISYARPGQQLRRRDWNTVVDYVKGHPFNQSTGGSEEFRRHTVFYTTVDIPAYSIFPLKPTATSTKDTFNAIYDVEKFDEDNIDSYIPGLFGTNGRFKIQANTPFLGEILCDDWDTAIIVTDWEEGATRCGFQDGSWEATIDTEGLVINGSAPQVEGSTYYCRRYNPPDYEGWIKSDMVGYYDIINTAYDVKLARGKKRNGSCDIEAYASLLNFNSTIKSGTPVLCRWFDTLNRWIIVEASCGADSNYSSSCP